MHARWQKCSFSIEVVLRDVALQAVRVLYVLLKKTHVIIRMKEFRRYCSWPFANELPYVNARENEYRTLAFLGSAVDEDSDAGTPPAPRY